jgi:hypothetical protein
MCNLYTLAPWEVRNLIRHYTLIGREFEEVMRARNETLDVYPFTTLRSQQLVCTRWTCQGVSRCVLSYRRSSCVLLLFSKQSDAQHCRRASCESHRAKHDGNLKPFDQHHPPSPLVTCNNR